MGTITMEREDGWFVITDEETGVTTQGETKLEALLMLADALAGFEDIDEDLLGMALNVFVRDPEAEELVAEFRGDAYNPSQISEERVQRQREAALELAKTHETIDHSDAKNFTKLRSRLQG